MGRFSDDDYKLLQGICKLKQTELLKVLTTILKKNYKEVVSDKNYVYAIGEEPVCLIAHLDTVFQKAPKNIFFDREQGVIWSPQGLGADDRAGVFAILRIISAGLRPSVVFTLGEESGGIGAGCLISRCRTPFANFKYLIELDRQGEKDCVFYDCNNKKFVKYIESFGFEENYGSFSDISILAPKWQVAAVNLSVGYKDEHTQGELLYIEHLLNTIQKVENLIKDAKNVKKPFKYIPYRWYGHNWGFPYAEDYETTRLRLPCEKCHKRYEDYEIFFVKGVDGEIKYYCPDCIVENVQWCEKCQDAFEIDPQNPEGTLCFDCLKEGKKTNAI